MRQVCARTKLGLLSTARIPFKEENMEAKAMRGHKGDRLIVTAHHVGESPRTGIVLEVLGEPDHLHYRVRWDDDRHESIFTPSNDVTFTHPGDAS